VIGKAATLGPLVLGAILALSPLAASGWDTTTCDGKHSWQRRVVRTSVHHWFANEAHPDDLLELVQAEQGIVACRARHGRLSRLHTATLPRGLAPDQLGALLLANELEWARLVPPPAEGLAGEWFQVVFEPTGALEAGE
jgi:hypothetical protein